MNATSKKTTYMKNQKRTLPIMIMNNGKCHKEIKAKEILLSYQIIEKTQLVENNYICWICKFRK